MELIMNIATSAQVKQLENAAINTYGMSEETLMENAAKGISTAILDEFRDQSDFDIFCGRGKNAGDGLLVARNLKCFNKNVTVHMTDSEDDLNPLTAIAYNKAKEVEVEIVGLTDKVKRGSIIIDALLGIGIVGEPRGNISDAIRLINDLPNKVLSIDIPSGLNGDSGRNLGDCVRADKTYVLAIDKVGTNVYPGVEFCGEKVIIDIGIPEGAYTSLNYIHHLTDDNMVKVLLPKRDPNGHKGTFGKVGIVGGSGGMSGAVLLSAKAALRAGAGMVYLFMPEDLVKLNINKPDEIIILPDSMLESYFNDLDVIAIGMGMGQNPKIKHIMKQVMLKFTKTVVVDADGLNFLANNNVLIQKKSCRTILTPHAVEFSRLIKQDVKEVLSNRIYFSTKFAKDFGSVIVLKGARTITSDIYGNVRINTNGNSGMSTAGSGDVLSGIIAAICAQGNSPFDAASIGVFLHGLSGDLVKEEKTEYGLIASDLIEYLPKAFKKIL